jgi:tetratricopeptide (TPR) repeat protein
MVVQAPLCFVLMPFGRKPDATGQPIDFDAVYRDVIAPAITATNLQPLRADDEVTGGVIHKAMFERLILCDYAVADLTTANANVFYELGVRHAVRPWSTVLLFAGSSRLPFDVAPLRAMPYQLTAGGVPGALARDRAALARLLRAARDGARRRGQAATDSPLFQLVEGFPQVDPARTDVFRDGVSACMAMQDRLAAARRRAQQGAARAAVTDVRQVEADLGHIAEQDPGVVMDLLLSYRAVGAWAAMIALVGRMAGTLAGSVPVQEQLALALNRAGEPERAEAVLQAILDRHGPSSETYGLLGRVYKGRWEAALARGDTALARGLLDQAIRTYLRGFEADWRDPYPGINALTVMDLRDPPDPRREELRPIVAYAVRRRLAGGKPDYWDHATSLELAVLARDQVGAEAALADALAAAPQAWQRESTAHNLALIRAARARRGEALPWAERIEQALRPPAKRGKKAATTKAKPAKAKPAKAKRAKAKPAARARPKRRQRLPHG